MSSGTADGHTVFGADGGALVGTHPNHWVYYIEDDTTDLTRPDPPFHRPTPGSFLPLHTTTGDIAVSPKLSALVIIDMQNFFLSPALERDADGAGNKAKEILINTTIPAARKAGIRVIWLNWGLDDDELEKMSPSVKRKFGRLAALRRRALPPGANAQAEGPRGLSDTNPLFRGLGVDIGPVKLADGSEVEAGKLLYADTWNAALPPDLQKLYEEGLSANPPDVWIHKNRLSGLWDSSTPCCQFLATEGLKTLFFTGVNTDQCVGGSMADAFARGYDTILINDACGTTSPDFAQQAWEYNASKTYGYMIASEDLRKGVQKMADVGSK